MNGTSKLWQLHSCHLHHSLPLEPALLHICSFPQWAFHGPGISNICGCHCTLGFSFIQCLLTGALMDSNATIHCLASVSLWIHGAEFHTTHALKPCGQSWQVAASFRCNLCANPRETLPWASCLWCSENPFKLGIFTGWSLQWVELCPLDFLSCPRTVQGDPWH